MDGCCPSIEDIDVTLVFGERLRYEALLSIDSVRDCTSLLTENTVCLRITGLGSVRGVNFCCLRTGTEYCRSKFHGSIFGVLASARRYWSDIGDTTQPMAFKLLVIELES
jgi:hypothetical protein